MSCGSDSTRDETTRYGTIALAHVYRLGPEDERRRPIVIELSSILDQLERVPPTPNRNTKMRYGAALRDESFDSEALVTAIGDSLIDAGADRRKVEAIEFGGMPSEFRGGLHESVRLALELQAQGVGDSDLFEIAEPIHAVLFSFRDEIRELLGRTINAATARLCQISERRR